MPKDLQLAQRLSTAGCLSDSKPTQPREEEEEERTLDENSESCGDPQICTRMTSKAWLAGYTRWTWILDGEVLTTSNFLENH